MNGPLWIVAKNLGSAQEVALARGLPKTPGHTMRSAWRYASSERALRGLSKIRVIYADDWTEHRDAAAINYAIHNLIFDVVVVDS